ncbi:MAG TPA: isochorismatase family protein [Vicinamibacterales bacterium]|nr:isochorismatase family protein [Vicinamibacterales bacterium]
MSDVARSAAHEALVVVDVQRDFCPGGALPAPGCTRILPALNRALATADARGMPIYATRDWHPAETSHFAAYGGEWPPHCVQDTDGAAFHPDLRLPPDTIVISKGDDPDRPGYSAFDGHAPGGASFLADLRARGIESLYVGGLATDYCVKATVLDARRAGLHVVVLPEAIAAIDAHAGDGERAMAEMKAAGAAFAHEVAPPADAG